MQFKCYGLASRRFLSLLILLSIFLPSLTAQNLKARIDQVLQKTVTEMTVSLDQKYFATADDRTVVFRDVETAKVIAHKTLPGDIDDFDFTNNTGEMVIVYENNDDFPVVVLYDFLNEKTIKSRECSELEELGGTVFNPKNDELIMASYGGSFMYFNYKTDKSFVKQLEHDNVAANFRRDGFVLLINEPNEGVRRDIFLLNLKSNELLESPEDLKSFEILMQLNNKIIAEVDDSLLFIDFINDFSFQTKMDQFLNRDAFGLPNSDFMTVHDFAFSPDGKHIAIVGGEEPVVNSVVGVQLEISIPKGSGYVSLYNVDKNRKIWDTDNQERKPTNIVKDLSWFENESFFITDRSGEIQQYHISGPAFQKHYPLPENIRSSMSITRDLSAIAYCFETSNTLLYEIGDVSSVYRVSDHYAPRIFMDDDLNILNLPLETEKAPTLNESLFGIYLSDSVFLNGPHIRNVKVSPNGRNFSYRATDEEISIGRVDFVENPSFLYDEQSKVMGFMNGSEHVIEANKYKGNENLVSFSSASKFVHINLNDTNTSYFFTGYKSIKGYSNNERFAGFSSYSSGSQVFDFEKEQWKYFQNNTTTNLSGNCFAQNSSKAFALFENLEYEVWDTEDESTIIKGKLDFKWMNNNKFSNVIDNDPRAASSENLIQEYFKKLYKHNVKISFHTDSVLLISINGNLVYLYLETGELQHFAEYSDISFYKSSPDGSFIYTISEENDEYFGRIISSPKDQILYQHNYFEGGSRFNIGGATDEHIYFHHSKPLAFIHNGFGSLDLFDFRQMKPIATLRLYEDGNWLVYTPEGIFDASKEGRNALYYTKGTEVILFDQLKSKYWEPGLLDKLINNPELLESVSLEQSIDLYPKLNADLENENGTIRIKLTERKGGIGRVSFFLNDKEIIEDINPQRANTFTLDLNKYKHRLYEQGLNKVSFKAYNKTGWLGSRLTDIYLDTNIGTARGDQNNPPFRRSSRRTQSSSGAKARLFGLFVGSSKYKNDKLNLKYADKDAHELRNAIAKISEGMYDPDQVELHVLVSKSNHKDSLATKENINKVFKKFANQAKPNDIIILFFSGHGMTLDDDFYYLTSQAGNVDLVQDVGKRAEICLSSKEINEALRDISSNKQVMILDACHSGQITKIFEGASKATSTSQQKALEDLEDKMGLFILASSEANQKSFETERLGQGLLTFSLLHGMSGPAASDGDWINVNKLLSFASEETERISQTILGRSQRPVLGIGKGGNSFPLGFKNESLRVPLPKNIPWIGSPKMGMLPALNDPLEIERMLYRKLESRGTIGSNESFLFIKDKENKEAYSITGHYKEVGKGAEIEWYILQNEKVIYGPFNEKFKSIEIDVIANTLINGLVEKIK